MKPMNSAVALLLSTAFSVAVQAQALPAQTAVPAPSAPQPDNIYDRPPSSRPLAPDVVVAQGDVELTLTDIDARISRIPPDNRANFINDPDRIETLLRNMLLTKRMAKEAEAAAVDKDPVVAADIEYAREEILAKRRSRMILADIKFPNFETLAKEKYLANPQLYRSPERISVRHILIARDKHGDEEAKRIAEQVHAEVIAKPDDFVAYVEKYSDDDVPADIGAAADKGLIKDVAKGDVTTGFDEAAFALEKIGDISPVVRTRFGYHIIKLEGRTPSVRYDYDKVKPQILEELKKDFLARARQDFLDKARSVPIDANPPLLQALRTRYLPGAAGAKAIGTFDSGVSAAEFDAQLSQDGVHPDAK
jgi:peptidyl-prolyl cis-trans isomerase C